MCSSISMLVSFMLPQVMVAEKEHVSLITEDNLRTKISSPAIYGKLNNSTLITMNTLS